LGIPISFFLGFLAMKVLGIPISWFFGIFGNEGFFFSPRQKKKKS
jgi:uncharacterized protein YneF (UPF0154 family)